MAAIDRYPVVLKADGLAAGKGVVDRAERRRGSRRRWRISSSIVATEPAWSSSRSFWRAGSFRCWRCAMASAPCRWHPRATTSASSRETAGRTRAGMGSYSPVAGFDTARVRELAAKVHQPIVESPARARDALPRGALRRADAHRRRPARAGVQRALRRPGDPGGTAAAASRTCWSCCSAPRALGGLQDARLEWSADCAVTVVLASSGYPASSSSGDPIAGLERLRENVEVTHAGTALTRRRNRDRRWTRAERDRLSARTRASARESGVCCGADDLLRGNADAERHRGCGGGRRSARCGQTGERLRGAVWKKAGGRDVGEVTPIATPLTETEVGRRSRRSTSTPRAWASWWAPRATSRRWRRPQRSSRSGTSCTSCG